MNRILHSVITLGLGLLLPRTCGCRRPVRQRAHWRHERRLSSARRRVGQRHWQSDAWRQDFGPGDQGLGFDKGVNILHFLGGHSADLKGNRAISQTKMTISQRALVHDVLVDVVCTGRFHDFLEKRNGRWGMVLRQPIYEKDRMDPVDPAARLTLDKALLERFPVGYRHLAYLQTQIGFTVKTDMPGLKGPEVEALYAKGRAWLEG